MYQTVTHEDVGFLTHSDDVGVDLEAFVKQRVFLVFDERGEDEREGEIIGGSLSAAHGEVDIKGGGTGQTADEVIGGEDIGYYDLLEYRESVVWRGRDRGGCCAEGKEVAEDGTTARLIEDDYLRVGLKDLRMSWIGWEEGERWEERCRGSDTAKLEVES